MADNDFFGEAPVNYEQKCPCVLVLDTSHSMSGDPLNDLNQGLKDFKTGLANDPTALSRLEVCIITFSSDVETVQDFALLEDFDMPTLQVNGTTRLVDGVREAIRAVENRKDYYKQSGQTYYRPYIILVTDGEPDRNQDMDGLSQEIKSGVDGSKFRFWAFGVEGANMQKLKEISHPEFRQIVRQTLAVALLLNH